MFERAHHQAIARVLAKLDTDLLERTECYFGGGTAIALSAGEYRESVDIDFLVSSAEGYRELRERIAEKGINGITTEPVELARDMILDQYGLRGRIKNDSESPIKIEIVKEGRIELAHSTNRIVGIPALTREDMYSQKLLANSDRWLDASVMHRDIIDLAMMIDAWGEIPESSVAKAAEAYGKSILNDFRKAAEKIIQNPAELNAAIAAMAMDAHLALRIPAILGAEAKRLCPEFNHANTAADGFSDAITQFVESLGKTVQELDSESGLYIGTVLLADADNGVVQDLGRATVAVHTMQSWEALPTVGQQYRVKYDNGIADWQPKQQNRVISRSR